MTSSAPLCEPLYHTSPGWDFTYGPEVAELMALASDDRGPYVMDPEQRLVLDDWFGMRADGKPAAFSGTVIAPRQNLKTGVLKAAALGNIYILEQRLVVWSAHEFFAAQEAFRDIRALIESSPDLEREVVRFWTSSGSESVEFTGDRRIVFKARHSNSGRSLSGDKVILDEGFALGAEELAALLPTLAARPAPQVLIGSSAGLPRSGPLRDYRDEGRAGRGRVAYAEWAAEQRPCASPECPHWPDFPGCAMDDHDLWLQANTAITRGRITIETIDALRRSMRTVPRTFARECLGWWDDPVGASEAAIAPDVWEKCRLDDAYPPEDPVLVLDVSPTRSFATILAAGTAVDGRHHVEVTSRDGVGDWRPGTDWVLPRFGELAEALPNATVRMLAKSQASAFAAKIEQLGLAVDLVPMGDYPAMCAAFVSAVETGAVVHLGGEALSASVAAGVLVDVGEEQARWGRRKSSSDITALVAATLGVDWVRSQRGTVSAYAGGRGVETV